MEKYNKKLEYLRKQHANIGVEFLKNIKEAESVLKNYAADMYTGKVIRAFGEYQKILEVHSVQKTQKNIFDDEYEICVKVLHYVESTDGNGQQMFYKGSIHDQVYYKIGSSGDFCHVCIAADFIEPNDSASHEIMGKDMNGKYINIGDKVAYIDDRTIYTGIATDFNSETSSYTVDADINGKRELIKINAIRLKVV